MRAFRFYALSFGAVAVLTFAVPAAGQSRPSVLLNSVAVPQLIERGSRGDHERLSAHFAALAARYTAEARRHTSMAQAVVGNPSRNLTTGLSAHCKRLTELNTATATTLSELAAHHDKLAAGQGSTAPPAGARFEAGTAAPTPTDQELTTLASNARTAGDHRRLEEYFLLLAKRYSGDAADHARIATSVRSNPRIPTATAIAAHCERVASAAP